MRKIIYSLSKSFFAILVILLGLQQTGYSQHVAGGGTGTGPNVTITDNGSSVTLNNGIVSITIDKTSAVIHNYSYQGINLYAGGHNGGYFYWSWNMPNFEGPNGSYSLNVDPASNGGNYAEVKISCPWSGSSSNAAMDVTIYYSLRRGAQGFYAAATLHHPASYPDNPGGEWRCNNYVGSIFDWLSVDSLRNRKMANPSNSSVAVNGAPKEVTLWTSGIYSGHYECKYGYSADLGDQNVWGWTSTSKKVGIWMTVPSHEYYNGGPMKRELTGHIGNTLLNMLNGEHYGMGHAFDMAAGTDIKKTYGPFLIYANSYSGSVSSDAQLAGALWKDAQEQAVAEQAAWPYTWFQSPDYIQESGRGTVTGTLTINDSGDPNASPAGMWIGLAPDDNGTDFQEQATTYQFWVKTDQNGGFTIPHVLPGTYNLWAFGPGAAGTFKQANVSVAAGQTLNLSTVTWKPNRTAATVWEIGIPDRDTKEFFNGHPAPSSPSDSLPPYAVWGTFLDFHKQFPNGLIYTVGKSDWSTDWNYAQPSLYNSSTSQYDGLTWTIDFDLGAPPVSNKQAAIYIALAADFYGPIIVTVNGTDITTPSTGFFPAQSRGDAMLRLGSHGAFSDQRITFNSSLLKQGTNNITLNMRKGGYGNSAMYDYIRLECDLNQPPVVTFTTPVRDTAFTAPADILLTATVSGPNSSISVSQVDFYNGTTLLGTATSSPYQFDWTNVTAGTYLITVKATASNGLTATDTMTIQVNPPTDCSGTPYGTAILDNCGQCVGGNTGNTACTGSIQGENFCSAQGVQESINTGFLGSGYLNFNNTAGSSASWYIDAQSAVSTSIGVRYANGGATARGMTISVNGIQQTTLSCSTTGSWTTWTTEYVTLNFTAGANLIQFTATTTDGGPNIDLLSFTNSGLSAGNCTTDCNGVLGGGAYTDSCGTCVGGNTGKTACTQDCLGDWGGSAIMDACGVCTGGNSNNKPCTDSLQAETACTVDGTLSESINTGYSGTGYVNTSNTLGASVSWVLNSTSNQSTTLTFRYANGGTTSRDGQVSINGTAVTTVSMPSTGAWTTWNLASINVPLISGANNLMVSATTANGLANLDLIYYSAGVSEGQCVITGITGSTNTTSQTVYPSPTKGKIKWTGQQNWIVINALGKELERGTGTSTDLSDYPGGVYFIKLGEKIYPVIKE